MIEGLRSFLGKVDNWIFTHRVPRAIYRTLNKIGLFHFILFLCSAFFHKFPTQGTKNNRQFFLDHSQELREVYDSLEDDKSRFVFENILKYWSTLDWASLQKSRGTDSTKTQYFVPELPFSDHEVIVDCGAYDGDSAKRFYERIPGCRVIALEPDEANFEVLKKLELEGLIAIKCGAWSEDTILRFSDKGGGTASGAIDGSGGTEIEARALDNLPECQSATYIKMDIEGAELEALKGAEKIIKTNKPKLAICLYHKPQDFFEIPLYIKKLNPDYKLFVHHHHPDRNWETVLYAV